MKFHSIRALRQHLQQREGESLTLLVLFTTLLIALIWGAAFHLIGVERASVESASVESSRELVETYEAQMIRSLGAIDQTLKAVKYAHESGGRQFMLADLQARGLVPSSLVFAVSIADRNGNIVDSTRERRVQNIARKPYFTIHATGDLEAPYIGRAAYDTNSDERDLRFSRRLNQPDKSFDGIVIVQVDPAYFTSGYEHSRLGEQGVLGLVGTDGIFRVKRTGDNITVGTVVDVAELLKSVNALEGKSVLVQNTWDRVRRYSNVRALHGFPLIAITGLAESEQFNVFQQHKSTYLWVSAVATLLLIAVSILLGRALQQMARNRLRMRDVQETFYAASEASLDGFFLLRSKKNGDGKIMDFVIDDMNSRAEALAGTTKQAMLGKTLCQLFPDSRRNGVLRELVSVATSGKIREKEWKNNDPRVLAEWLYREVVRVQGGVVAIVRDITERKRAEVLRAEQGRVLEMIASSMPLGQILINLMQLVESQAPHFMASVRLLDEDGLHLRHAAAPSLPENYTKGIDRIAVGPNVGSCGAALSRRAAVVSGDIPSDPLWDALRSLAARYKLQACCSTPIVTHDGKVLGTLALYVRRPHRPTQAEMQLIDMVTRIAGIAIERRHAEERIRHMAHHDVLTGLPNRALLDDRLRQAMLHAQRNNRMVTVALLDLDNFKLVNDSLGHSIGDELLQIVADRMCECVRRTDTVARLGGDEFAILLCDQKSGADSITPTLQKISDALAQPIRIGPHTVQITASIGVAMYPGDGVDVHTLIRNADTAMYRAKELGHNRCKFYTEEMNARIHEKFELREGLRNAIANQEFRLLYQPQVDLRTGQMLGVEALIRWEHPTMGMVSPIKFISDAEETGLIVPIGDWVLHTACRQNKAWQDAGMRHITMSVNVSARQFRESNLVSRVAHALHETGLEPQYLELELTESLIVQDLSRAIETMRELQAMGVNLSIDDFGTGYSSLSALKSFPIVRLKIDRSFVSDLPGSEDDKVIASAVISLGHKLGLRVIAEGVETTQQLAFLRENDCDEMQGYFFSKPVMAAEVEKLLVIESSQPAGDIPVCVAPLL